MKKVFWIYCLLLILGISWSNTSQAQTNKNHPLKYNKEFSAIGPKVYILPPPKTKEEIIQDKYSLKKKEQLKLTYLIKQLELANRLKIVDNGILPENLSGSIPMEKEARIQSAIRYYVQTEKIDSVLAWQNHLGTIKLLKGQIEDARALFLQVLNEYQKAGNISNQQAILFNLAILEDQAENYLISLTYYDKLILLAKNSRNTHKEGLLSLAIAIIESKLGNYSAAHNLVIKKSFPLLQKSKYFPDVVNALNTLAKIKESETKFTEAKWIYLQAIDVATIYKDEKGLARSLFNLAELKSYIGDNDLAIEDYKAAKNLASKHNMKALLVEVEDGLGDIYLAAGNYTEAALSLSSYNIFKIDFINNQILM